MTLVKFNNRNRLFPWSNDRLKNYLSSDEFFNNDFFTEDHMLPAMNIKDHDKNIEIELAAPGFSKKDFEITIEDNILHVCGEKSKEEEEKEDDCTRKEFSYNSFKRSLKLPDTIKDEAKIKAVYKNGILKLDLPKKEMVKKEPLKKIEII